jgi:hypothetical protein
MKYGELPIYRAPEDKKVEGFSLVEDFFRDLDSHPESAQIAVNKMYQNPRGVFQALSLLVDFGHLEEANVFIRSNTSILKIPFEIKNIEINEYGDDVISDEYAKYSPLLIIAPYLVRKANIENKRGFVRPLFYRYEDDDAITSRYSRDKLMDTLSLWLKLGMDVISRNGIDEIEYSLLDMAIDMEFDSAYVDVALKFSLTSPAYADEYKTDFAIKAVTKAIILLDKANNLNNDDRQRDMRYIALLFNTYFKYDGESLFDSDLVRDGNMTEIQNGLRPYVVSKWLDMSSFGLLIEVLYIVLRGQDVFNESQVLQVDSMKLLMEIHDIDPVTALTMVTNDDQRDVVLSILSGN